MCWVHNRLKEIFFHLYFFMTSITHLSVALSLYPQTLGSGHHCHTNYR